MPIPSPVFSSISLTPTRRWPRAWLVLALLWGPACTDRAAPDDDLGDSSEGEDPDDPGDQPAEPGAMYSSCQQSSECAPQEFCVFPQGEAGFCTSACAAPTNPGNCDAPPGNQSPTCFDIGLIDGRRVCALECGGASCPRGMRCEMVAADDGERSICF